MRLIAVALLTVTIASCGSSLSDSGQPTPADGGQTTLPAWGDPDCTISTLTACPLDVAKLSVGIDINYPNVSFCRLRIEPSEGFMDFEALGALASSWQATMGYGPNNQTVLAPEMPQTFVEYPLGTERLYVTRVTFTSKSSDTLATLIANAVGPNVGLYAVPIACP